MAATPKKDKVKPKRIHAAHSAKPMSKKSKFSFIEKIKDAEKKK